MLGRKDYTREDYDRGQAAVDRQPGTLVPGGKRQPGQPRQPGGPRQPGQPRQQRRGNR